MVENTKLNSASHKNTFAKDVLKMASAPLCTQILGIILMPIITRMYIPDVYGTFQLYASIVMPIAVFVGLGYSSSIVLPQKDEVAANMLFVSLSFTLIITLLSILFIYFGSGYLLEWLKAPGLKAYLWVIPVNVFAHGLYLSLRSWNVRHRNFGRIAASRISDAAVNKGVLIGAGLCGFATSGSLIAGRLVGSISMSSVLGARIWQNNAELFKRSIRWHSMLQGIKRYRKFPMYNLWTDLISRLAATVVIFSFSFYFSKTVIGYYGLCIAVLSLPMTFIAGSISEVFYQRGARARHDGTNGSLIEKLFSQMVKLGMLAFLVLAVAGEDFFAFIFGANWSEAGVYTQILTFQIFIAFIMTPANALANILERQEVLLVFHIVSIIVSGASVMIGGLANNVYVALCLFSLLNGLATLAFGLYMFKIGDVSLLKIFKMLSNCFVSCLPVISVIAAAKFFFDLSPLVLIAIITVSCMIYYGIYLKKDEVLRSAIQSVFKKTTPV